MDFTPCKQYLGGQPLFALHLSPTVRLLQLASQQTLSAHVLMLYAEVAPLLSDCVALPVVSGFVRLTAMHHTDKRKMRL